MRKVILLASSLSILAGVAPALAQQAPGNEKQPAAAASAGAATATAQQEPAGKALVALPIYSSDGKKVGKVKSVDVGSDGTIKSMQAEINGFVGLGTTSVRIGSDAFKHTGDRVVLSETADQVRGVPGASYQPWH